MALNLSIIDEWTGRDAFYEKRVPFRSHENDRFYQQLVRKYYSFLVPTGVKVLEMGCGLGDLLASVRPLRGIGVDFSARTLALARQRHPELEFFLGDAATWSPKESLERVKQGPNLRGSTSPGLPDYILLADLINDLPDVQAVFKHLRNVSHTRTRLVLNFLSNLWRPVLAVAEWGGAKSPTLSQNWLSTPDVKNLLHLAGWEVIKEDHRILWPARTPVIGKILNSLIAPFLAHCCLSIFLVARPRICPSNVVRSTGNDKMAKCHHANGRSTPRAEGDSHSRNGDGSIAEESSPCQFPHFTCSVIIPARNEAGNIDALVRRTPDLGLGTEMIFVEGHSSDGTWQEIQRALAKYPDRKIKALKQGGSGKGDAVRQGFAAATGDLFLILDADLTVAPEDLPKFYDAARSGIAEFVNGVRLVYPMETEAMRFLNMCANKIFGLTFSWLLGQQLKDTLCGTKVMFRWDYEMLVQNRSYFGEFDPFGDFDLLFGAAKLNLRMVDLPIRYRARSYGATNIRRWRHGWLLLRMVLFAAGRLKFI